MNLKEMANFENRASRELVRRMNLGLKRRDGEEDGCFSLQSSKYCGTDFGEFSFPRMTYMNKTIANINQFDSFLNSYFLNWNNQIKESFGCTGIPFSQSPSLRTAYVCEGLLNNTSVEACNKDLHPSTLCQSTCVDYVNEWVDFIEVNSDKCEKSNQTQSTNIDLLMGTCYQYPFNGQNEDCIKVEPRKIVSCEKRLASASSKCSYCDENPDDLCCKLDIVSKECTGLTANAKDIAVMAAMMAVVSLIVLVLLIILIVRHIKKRKQQRNKIDYEYGGNRLVIGYPKETQSIENMSYANYNNMTEHENNSNTSVDSKVSYGKNVKNDSYLYRPNNYNSDKEERKKKKKTGNDKGSIRESARSVGPLDKYQVEMRIDEEASFYSFQKEVQHDISRSYVGDSFPTSRQAKARRDSNEWRESGIGINIPDYPVKKSVSENDKYRLEKNGRTGKYEKSGKRGQRTYENTFEMSRPSSGKGRAVGKGSMSAPGESYEMKVKQKTLPTPYYSDDSHQPSSSDGKKLSVISVSSFHKDETLYDVVYDYTPNEYDELELKVGDRLRIIKVFSDGWALVKHHAQKNIGIVPMVCIDYKK